MDDAARIDRMQEYYQAMRGEIAKVIVGQEQVIEEMLIALFAGGHVLLEGVPGLAKTLLISSLSRIMDLSFNRIQFTPDLMPSDITGSEILEEDHGTGHRSFKFVQGPIFANVILADEINRTPPKTQAALLEAMQERQVTAGGQKHVLDAPFFVLATQNPIEQEGTYPLPEAQLDRFMFMVKVSYPTMEQEEQIVAMTTRPMEIDYADVLTGSEILEIQEVVRRVPIPEHVVRYALRLVRATRVTTDEAIDTVRERVAWGAGPRASQYLVLGAKARAILHGRETPAAEDIRAVAPAGLRHRLVTNFNAEADGIKPDDIIKKLLDEVPEPDKK